MSDPGTSRVVHLTAYKCGSQWVRDVLTSPEVLEHSGGMTYSRATGALGVDLRWSDLPGGAVSGPIYLATREAWGANARAGDRALVVLRDPRDLVVSWVYSVAYSHKLDHPVTFRKALLLQNSVGRLVTAMSVFKASMARFFYTWAEAGPVPANVYRTTYERLVADEEGEFSRIFEFLGWPVPPAALQAATQRWSFSAQSGRSRGDENIHSHFRKGVAGDWSQHFDRITGRLFEDLCPKLLVRLGYETDAEWWSGLPEPDGRNEVLADLDSQLGTNELRAEIARLEEAKRGLALELHRRRTPWRWPLLARIRGWLAHHLRRPARGRARR